MTPLEQRKAAIAFAKRWKGRGREQGEKQVFWTELLTLVYGVPAEEISTYITFEKPVHYDDIHKNVATGAIDAYIPRSKDPILIEHKSSKKTLTAKDRQSDGAFLTPYEQACRYADGLGHSENPKWIITCNFVEFRIYDMDKAKSGHSYEPNIIQLKELGTRYRELLFLADPDADRIAQETALSTKAGTLVGKLYDALETSFGIPTMQIDSSEYRKAVKDLNKLIVRIIFCLYAEDANLFGNRGNEFTDYICHDDQGKKRSPSEVRNALIRVFAFLETKEEDRDPHAENRVRVFPYVNGKLFAEEIQIPPFNDDIVHIIVEDCGNQFDWQGISPTIFGAVFESTLNPETRRKGGMHYTSIENIHKVINPLFLDDLKKEFGDIQRGIGPNGGVLSNSDKKHRCEELRKKMRSLKFLDPACGSGNFLTETFLSLRKLENDILRYEKNGVMSLDVGNRPDMVTIGQFYGIEINDFAVAVAKTALWIAEAQMFKETQEIYYSADHEERWNFFPLTTNVNIHEGNALAIKWNTVVPSTQCNYIMGNPPFVGYSLQTKEQTEDLQNVFLDENGKPYPSIGKLDYVAGWFFKSAKYIRSTKIKAALVSTNSLFQGQQVAICWDPIFKRFKIHFDFAYRSFVWDSDSSGKAHVHCSIVGFSCFESSTSKFIVDEAGNKNSVSSINCYLQEGERMSVVSRRSPISAPVGMTYGSKVVGSPFFLFDQKTKDEALLQEPFIEKYIRPALGGDEFINGAKRYCLWLVDASPDDMVRSHFIRERVEKVRAYRLASQKKQTKESASTPYLFGEIRQPNQDYLLIPRTSSEKRNYVPIGFISKEVIATDAVQFVPDATLYEFGILTSSVHMVWMKAVCGRQEMRYRYSGEIVYNTFIWPNPTPEQKDKIQAAAQEILEARNAHPSSSLEALYSMMMPVDLQKAHRINDSAVLEAYGLAPNASDQEILTLLIKMYSEAIRAEEEAAKKAARKKKRKKARRRK